MTNTEYAGNYIYENSSLQFFNHAEGYIEQNGSAYDYIFQCKDHLEGYLKPLVLAPTDMVRILQGGQYEIFGNGIWKQF